jgi:deaminated glutathione amidase
VTAESIIAAVQMSSGADVRANLAVAGDLLERAAQQGATLAVLPENFAFMGEHDRDKLAHAEDQGVGPIQHFLRDVARRLKLWIVAGTIPLQVPGDATKVFAASLVLDAAGEIRARYDKVHLFDVAVGGETYRESSHIAPGELKAVTVESPMGRLGLSVCYDLRFPELFRRLAGAHADILCVPSAFTQKTGEAHWEVLLRARAIENLAYVIAPGQCGSHPGGRRTYGHSLIVGPWGEGLGAAGTEPGVVISRIAPARLHELRQTFPVLSHRRFDPQ